MGFPDILRNLRNQREISQEELAAAIGVHQQTISIWETGAGQPDIQGLCFLADYFGVSIDYLVGHVLPQPEDSTVQMKRLLNSLTPEQVSLLCAIAMKALKSGKGEE